MPPYDNVELDRRAPGAMRVVPACEQTITFLFFAVSWTLALESFTGA
jgi:hypothetical protein